MHILLTGGSGVLSACLAKILTEEGHQVENRPVFSDSGEAFDAVYYGTGLSCTDEARRELQDVLEACCRQGVQRFIFFSSAAVYGETKGHGVSENEAPAPVSALGKDMAAAEALIRRYEDKGLQAFILRCANIYGEGLEDDVVSCFARALARGRDLTIFGDGEQSRDFVYLKDVACAAAAALNADAAPGIYNVSTKIETTINALKEILLYFSRAGVAVSYEDARDGDVSRSVLDNAKTVAAFKWRPKTKLMPGLMATYQYFLEKEEAE